MFIRLMLCAVVLGGALVNAAPAKAYVVAWSPETKAAPERRALLEQVDRQLREELIRRGAVIVDGRSAGVGTIVLRPRLEVLPGGLKLSVLGVRQVDHAVLGSISAHAAGSTRSVQVRAVINRACDEAELL